MHNSGGWCAALGAGAVVMVLSAGCGFNEVVERDEDVKGAWSEVQNQYQRRSDLVPNLVSVVKGAAGFEQQTLSAVTTARSNVSGLKVDASVLDDPARFKQLEAAQQQLTGALSRLIAVSENYPDLKATAAFRDLLVQLEGTENRIAVSRGRYVASVAEYNKVVLRFPSMVGARMRGRSVRPTFEATTVGADKAPQVAF
jgi:LemA protein